MKRALRLRPLFRQPQLHQQLRLPTSIILRRSASSDGSTCNNSGKGYQSIGSFHSESVEVLTTLPEQLYTPPALPFACPSTESLTDKCSLRSDYDYGDDFLLDQTNWTFLNHGAFGGALKCGYARAESWRLFLERQPLRYFDRALLPHLANSNRLLCHFVNGKQEALSLIQNATVGLNAVIGGYTREYKADSLIMYFDVAYGSVKKMCQKFSGQVGGKVVEIPFQDKHLPFATSSSLEAKEVCLEVLQETIDAIQKEGLDVDNALLILDHTTSNTAINMPIEELARKAKEENMLVLVDGAHGVLAQDLDMTRLETAGISFYVGNCHKWLSCPRGAAMVYCPNEDLRNSVLRIPPVVSHGVDDGYVSRFLWDGCRDYAAQLSLPVVLEYWGELKTENVRRQMRRITENAVRIVTHLWHPHLGESSDLEEMSAVGVTLAPTSMHSPLVTIRLPDFINTAEKHTSADAKRYPRLSVQYWC